MAGQVDRRRHPGPDRADRRGHRCQQRPRRLHGAGAGPGRRDGDHGLSQHREGRASGRGDPLPGTGGNFGAPRARPGRSGLRRDLRFAGRRRPAGSPDQQRRGDGAPAPVDQGRFREPVREQPPRPFRAHRPSARRSCSPRRPPRGHAVERGAPDGDDQVRRPPARERLQQLARLRAVEARQPHVLLRATAARQRRRRAAAQHGRAPRLRGDQPPVRRQQHGHRAGDDGGHQPGGRPERRHGRAPHAVRRHLPGYRADRSWARTASWSSAAIPTSSLPPAGPTTSRRGAGCGRSPRS